MPHEVCAPTFVPELDRSFPKTDFDGKVDLHRVWLRSRPGQATSNETMTIQHHSRARYVIGPDGRVLTVADLPPRNTKRWVIRRKAELVAAVRGGLLSLGRSVRTLHTYDRRISFLAENARPPWPTGTEGDPRARLPRVTTYSLPDIVALPSLR